MDIVLEIFDTFGFDYLYSTVLPAGPAPYYLSGNVAGSSNSTLPRSAFSIWQYKPATQFFSITPHEAAYSSSWNRNNPYRQGLSLFLITWFVLLHPGAFVSN
jgi:Delta7-sterol 5-desaturase